MLYSLPAVVPVLVTTSVPVVWFQLPDDPQPPAPADTSTAPSPVCVPVRPLTVSRDPELKSQSVATVMVSVLFAPDTGVLCWMLLVVKLGSTTYSALAPYATPRALALDPVISAALIDTFPLAEMLTVGAACPADGFLTSHEKP
eukprot:255116-Hanusia_phi.AAC.1